MKKENETMKKVNEVLYQMKWRGGSLAINSSSKISEYFRERQRISRSLQYN